jgi:hypothetical protein
MKERQKENVAAMPINIVAELSGTLAASSQAVLPSYDTIRKPLQRVARQALPQDPINLEGYEVPQMMQSVGDELFYQETLVVGGQKALIFATNAQLRLFFRAEQWFADGTFKCTPLLFNQLYIFHAKCFDEILPLVYVLCTAKTEALYAAMLRWLFEAAERLHLSLRGSRKSLSIDFEMAMKNAAQSVEGFEISVIGCYFHWCQCHWRKIQKLQLQPLYMENEELRVAAKSMSALAFVHPNDVEDAYRELRAGSPPNLLPLLDYFEKTYIGRTEYRQANNDNGRVVLRRHVIPPRFEVSMWNVFHRTIDRRARTNNAVESRHCQLIKILGRHRGLHRFIGRLAKQVALMNVRIEQLRAGAAAKEPTPLQKQRSARLFTLVQQYEQRRNQPLEFLHSVAHSIQYLD